LWEILLATETISAALESIVQDVPQRLVQKISPFRNIKHTEHFWIRKNFLMNTGFPTAGVPDKRDIFPEKRSFVPPVVFTPLIILAL